MKKGEKGKKGKEQRDEPKNKTTEIIHGEKKKKLLNKISNTR